MVKERLATLLGRQYHLVRSPRSFNSQLGVPLSVLQMGEEHELAIFEAGISEPGEMERLQQILRPDIGVFTGLGEAHQAQFRDLKHKLEEKLTLFKGCQMLVYGGNDLDVRTAIQAFCTSQGISPMRWGEDEGADLHILEHHLEQDRLKLAYCTGGKSHEMEASVPSGAYVQNEFLCLAVMVAMGEDDGRIASAFASQGQALGLPISSRSRTGDLLISQTGLVDGPHLGLALEELIGKGVSNVKTLILFEEESPLANEYRIKGMLDAIKGKAPQIKVLCLGNGLEAFAEAHAPAILLKDLAAYQNYISEHPIQGDVLLTGSWSPGFSQVRSTVEAQGHHTQVTIDMEAIVHNLNVFRSLVGADVKMMAMVKASAYGTGDIELAKLLEYQRIDYLGVAYADEGQVLRKQGIEVPIMVMNADLDEVPSMAASLLEPVVYSLEFLKGLCNLVKEKGLRMGVHLEFDTGMHRLGLAVDEVEEALRLITESGLGLRSVFSHLLASDDPGQDERTQRQIQLFEAIKEKVTAEGTFKPLFHLLNSSGISRFPEQRMDMVRLGVGLYGYSGDANVRESLKPILQWTTSLRQVKMVNAGETVGYGGGFTLDKDTRIGILPVGYADGLHRSLGNGVGQVFIAGRACPFVGNICMDLSMVDLGDLDSPAGSSAEIIGPHQSIEDIAVQMRTIPYEVLTNIPGRVKRNYVNG
jgi:alanine racemase